MRAVSELEDGIRQAKSQAEMAVSCIGVKVDEAIEKTNEKIEEMIADINLAGEVLAHNKEVYERLLSLKAQQEKALARAESDYESARANLSRAEKQSAGETEESRNARAQEIKFASSTVSSAHNAVSNTQQQLNQTNIKIAKIVDAINKLQYIISNINRFRNTALSFIASTSEKYQKLVQKQKEFEEVCKPALDKIFYYHSIGNSAEKYISNGLKFLSDASNSRQVDRVCISSTNVIKNLADLLKSMKSDAESFAKKQAKSSVNYLNLMGDDVSVATVGLCRDVSAVCVKCTSDFDKMADKLLKAKENFDGYAGLSKSW